MDQKEKELIVVKAWIERAKAENLKKGSKTYIICHNMFFLGAMTALGLGDYGVPAWSIAIMSGRDIVDLYTAEL